MYRLLFLFFAVTLMACDNDTPQEKPREQEKHEVPVPKSKPQFDEVGERIWYEQTPTMRLDSTDYGAGLTPVFGMRTSSISKQRFDSLFKQTVWEIKDIRVVETDLSLAKKNPGMGYYDGIHLPQRRHLAAQAGDQSQPCGYGELRLRRGWQRDCARRYRNKMVCAASQQKCSRIFAARSHHVGTF